MAHSAAPRASALLLIGGPTASAKSALAVDLAEAFGGVVINADSMQIYRDLPVLTAHPTKADLDCAPHRLFGALDGREPCSAARWRELAQAEISAAKARNLLPILVGGTGLYFKSLLNGLAPIPQIPTPVRERVAALRREIGAEAFHARLASRDPVMAARLHPGDTQRVLRAYEVHEATGHSLADWHTARHESYAGTVVSLVLDPARPELYAACNERFDRMLDAGATDEVARLMGRGLDPSLPVMKALGVREIAAVLDGSETMEKAALQAKQATRRYAKRQTTWFRHQMLDAHRIPSRYGPDLKREITGLVRRLLLTVKGQETSVRAL